MRTEAVVDDFARPTLLLLSAAVIDAALTAETARRSINTNAPTAGAPLSQLFGAATPVDARRIVIDATLLTEYALLSASDHARAFATLLRAPRRPATAIVTLTRAVLESLARSRWIVRDHDLNTLAHRTLSLLCGDLRHPAFLGEQCSTAMGRL